MPSQAAPPARQITPAHRAQSRLTRRLIILALVLAGFGLRLLHLGGESLWYDETVSAYLASLPVTELVAHTARDIHPPAYYLLLHLWQTIAHPTVTFGLEFLLAWPSFALSILVIVLIYAISKRSFGPTAALWALALAIFHPTQIWFSQEVRMYALGAFCLLLTLWAIVPYLIQEDATAQPPQRSQVLPRRSLILYPLAALFGLYSLYYFLFWLAILNLAVLYRQWRQAHALRTWVLLQIIVLVGWLPWLPIFVRQAITPPVPGWRVPWQSASEIVNAMAEGIASLWVGHTPPLEQTWPWAILLLALIIVSIGYTKTPNKKLSNVWLLLCFGSPILLFVVSLIGPPIYHVRYFSTYAPLVIIPFAALLASIRRTYAVALFLALTILSAVTLQQLWTNPLYTADDHRGAVATLAQQWRPGDAILVNVGWAYTALNVYWPTELSTPSATRPPAIAGQLRLPEITTRATVEPMSAPIIVRTGSVNGDPSLGWGLPVSDFFAMTDEQTVEVLEQLAATHPTIWHYRLYDTVSDPTAVIRNWLTDNTELVYSQPIPGRDFLRLEGYRTNAPRLDSPADLQIKYPTLAVDLVGITQPSQLPAGETLYINLSWQSTAATPLPTTLAISLRLYDSQGNLLVQDDTALTLHPGNSSTQAHALPIPADAIPGDYTLSLILYAPDTLAPYEATTTNNLTLPTPLTLGNVTIGPPNVIPNASTPIATFDYIELLSVELPSTPLVSGAVLDTAWTWRPLPRDYTDRYTAHLELIDGKRQRMPLADFTLGGDVYPSSQWPPGYPLRQRVATALPAALPAGNYHVHLRVTRASDGATIDARQPWQLWQQPTIDLGELQIVSAN